MHNLTPRIWRDGATREVFFALGLAAIGRDEAGVPGPVLITVLSDLGLSESAARAAILRLRRQGWLSSQRHGRHTYYAPTATIRARQQRVQEHFTAASPPWDGAFHGLIYEVPERHRAYRDRLRRCARLLGYASLRGGLLIAPTDGFVELQSLLNEPPDEAHLLPARIELAPAHARRLAHRLWALDALAEDYRARVVAVRDAINAAAGDPPAGPQALRAFAAATQPIYQAISQDPLLPSELLPDDWPAPELGAALQAALQTLGPAAVAYVQTLP
jgi:phenylacetic acid degradation operon negative regulatory protein